MIDHIKLLVSDLELSRGFYEQALAPLGYRIMMEPAPGVVGLGVERPDFWIAADPQTQGRATVHVAFRVDDREHVDAFHGAAIAAGGVDNGGAGMRAHYHPSYYGAFVLDPDGNNVEAVCHEP